MKNFLIKLGKTLILFLLCALISIVIVLPLWKWSVKSPKSYSDFIFLLIFALLCFLVYRQIKKSGFRKVLGSILKSLILIVTLCLFVYFVLIELRLIAFIILAAGLTVFFLACYLKPSKKLHHQ